jgi:DNA-binding CsgD family transcriptional regulator
MTRVTGRELRDIQRFLEGAYDAVATDPPDRDCVRGALPHGVLQALGALITADAVESFQLWRGVFDGVPHTTTRVEDEPPIVGAFNGRGGINPINAFAWSPADGPVRLSDLLTRRQLEALPMYRDYLGPNRIDDQLKIWLWSSPDSAACVSLDRSGGPFDGHDVAVLAIVQQHLAAMRESLMSQPDEDHDQSIEALTVREAQVLSWVARGRQNREIAELLFISPETVRKHLENAYAKLGVRNRIQAVAALRRSTPNDALPKERWDA